MTYLEKKQKLNYLLELIDKGRCFSLRQISHKFDCSERTVKRLLAILRDEGHEIKYCSSMKKFYLDDD